MNILLKIKLLLVIPQQLQNNLKDLHGKLKDLIEHLDKPDIVIVEGFKKENHKKIEIISNNSLEDQYLFPNLKNVFCIISD